MTYNKISAFAAGLILAAGAWSCSDKVDYTPTPQYTGDEVYFSNEESTEIAIPADATEVFVNIYRQNTAGELTVGVNAYVTDATGNLIYTANVFNPSTQVTFADGDNMAQLRVGVTFSAITPEEEYILHASIAGEKKTPYGLTEQEFTMVYAPWGEFKPYRGTEPALVTMKALQDFTDNPIPVYESKSLVNDNVKYQFGNYGCPELQENQSEWKALCNGNNGTIIYDPKTGYCTFPDISLNIDVQGNDLHYTDVYTYVTTVRPEAAGDNDPSVFQDMCEYLPEQGMFAMRMIYWTSAGILAQEWDLYKLPGFASYNFDFHLKGSMYYSDMKQEAVQISITRSEDLASYAYTLEPGELTEEQVKEVGDALAANTDAELIFDASTTLEFFLREPGKYTLVTVGYNEAGERKITDYYVFDYKPIVPYNWKTLGNAEYTDGFLYSMFNGIEAYTWDVEVEQSTENPGIIRLVNPYRYKAGGWPMGNQSFDLIGNYYVTLNIEDKNLVYVYEDQLGVMLSDNDGAISVSSQAYDLLFNKNLKPSVVKLRGYNGKMDEDQCITFPAGSLLIGFANYNGGEFLNTNFTPDYDPENETAAEQLKKTGEFFLDLSAFDLSGEAASKAPVKSRKAPFVKLADRQPVQTLTTF